MARFEITGPDGSRWEITAPDDATEEEIMGFAQQQFDARPAPEAPGLWDQFAYGFDSNRGLSQAAVEEFAERKKLDPEGVEELKKEGAGFLLPGPFGAIQLASKFLTDKTPEELAEVQARSDLERDLELDAEHPGIHNNPDAQGVGTFIGGMVRQMLDPTMLIGPAAGTGLKAAAAINASIMAADSTAMQLLDEGQVDPQQVVMASAAAAVLGPLAKVVGTGLRGAGRKAQKLLSSEQTQQAVQDKIIEAGARRRVYERLGLNETEATARAVRDISPKADELKVVDGETVNLMDEVRRGPQLGEGRKAMELRGNIVKQTKAILDSQRKLKKFEKKIQKAIINERPKGGNAFTNVYRSAYDAMSRVSPRLANRLRRYEYELGSTINRRLSDTNPEGMGLMKGSNGALTGRTLVEWKKTPKRLRDDTSLAMFNGDTAALNRLLPRLPARVQDAIGKWRNLRGEYQARIQESGHGDLDWVEEYFPREFVDQDHLRAHFLKRGVDGKIIDQTTEDLQRLYKGDPDSLALEKRVQTLNSRMRQPETGGVRTGPTSQMKERQVDRIGRSDLPAMRDPFETIAKYVNDVESNLAKRRLFGVDPNDLENSIGGLTDDLVRDGSLLPADAELARRILQARFVTGERSMNRTLQAARNLTNAALLGNPGSALIQFGDVAVSMAHNGVRNTLRGLWTTMNRTGELNRVDLGVTDVAAELNQAASKGTGKMLDTLLTWSGFRGMDNVGKQTAINSGLNKLRRWAKKQPVRLENKYGDALNPDELQALSDALASGRKVSDLTVEQAELVRYALFNELSDMQPVSLSELPVTYLEMPNGRLMYQLKSFTLKQGELLRREFLRKLMTDPAQAIKFGSRYLAATILLSGSVDYARNMLTGKYREADEGSIDEIFWQGSENMLMSATSGALNKWSTEDLYRGDLQSAVADQVLPPGISVASRIAQGVLQGRPEKSLRYIPMIGVFAPWVGDK